MLLEFPKKLDQSISIMAKREGLTKEQIIHRALAIYDYIQRKSSNKKVKIKIMDEQNNILAVLDL